MILMAANIRNIAAGHLFFLAPFTVINTYVWIYIVRTAIHSTKGEVFFYAMGSAVGAVLGVMVSHFLIKPNAITNFAAAALGL